MTPAKDIINDLIRLRANHLFKIMRTEGASPEETESTWDKAWEMAADEVADEMTEHNGEVSE